MSLPTYPEYKDSGVAGLGKIPVDWRVARFSRAIKGIKDGTHGTFTRVSEGEPLLSAKNVLDGKLDIGSDESLISSADYDEIVANGFPAKGDVLLTIVGTIGRSCIYPFERPYAFQRSVCFIRLCQEFESRFFYYFTQSTYFQEQLAGRSKSAAQAGVYMGDVVATTVLFPPDSSEQTDIATFLDRETGKIDALIAEQEKLLALLAEKRHAAISHAVTKGLNPDAPMKDSGVAWLGEVPEHWETIRLGALFREVSEPGNDELPVLSVSIHDGVSDKELDEKEMDRKVTRSEDRSKYKAVAPGDLTYNMMRAWQGGFGSVLVEGMVSPAYVVARPVREFSTSLIEQQLRTPKAVTEMKRHSRGITDFRLRLYWEEFKTICVTLPPKSEQDEILLFIERESIQLNALADEANRSIALLKERRSALIAAAVTGQIDVRSSMPPKDHEY